MKYSFIKIHHTCFYSAGYSSRPQKDTGKRSWFGIEWFFIPASVGFGLICFLKLKHIIKRNKDVSFDEDDQSSSLLKPWQVVICCYYFEYPAAIYLLNFNNRNSRARCEICSELTIKTPEQRHWCRSGVFIVNFEHIWLLVLAGFFVNLKHVIAGCYLHGTVVTKKQS